MTTTLLSLQLNTSDPAFQDEPHVAVADLLNKLADDISFNELQGAFTYGPLTGFFEILEDG